MFKQIKNKWKRLGVTIKGSIIGGMFVIFAVILNHYLPPPDSPNDSPITFTTNTTHHLWENEPPDTSQQINDVNKKLHIATDPKQNNEINDSLFSKRKIESVIDSANTNNVGIYYKVKLVIPWKMLGCKIFVDNNDANIIERNGIHIVIKIKGRQKSYKIKIENDKYKFGKEILIDKDIELTFSPEDIIT